MSTTEGAGGAGLELERARAPPPALAAGSTRGLVTLATGAPTATASAELPPRATRIGVEFNVPSLGLFGFSGVLGRPTTSAYDLGLVERGSGIIVRTSGVLQFYVEQNCRSACWPRAFIVRGGLARVILPAGSLPARPYSQGPRGSLVELDLRWGDKCDIVTEDPIRGSQSYTPGAVQSLVGSFNP